MCFAVNHALIDVTRCIHWALFIDEDTEALSVAGWKVVRTGSISSELSDAITMRSGIKISLDRKGSFSLFRGVVDEVTAGSYNLNVQTKFKAKSGQYVLFIGY